MRAAGWTVPAIALEVGAAKSSVSRWVADVPFTPGSRHRGGPTGSHPGHLARLRAEEAAKAAAHAEVGALSDRDLFLVGLALYAGEGAKTGNAVRLSNTDPRLVCLFLRWLRQFFAIDESRVRVALYLHDDLDLDAANEYWSELCDVPISQFTKPYRAVVRSGRKQAKHVYGCPSIRYADVRIYRSVMAGVDALY